MRADTDTLPAGITRLYHVEGVVSPFPTLEEAVLAQEAHLRLVSLAALIANDTYPGSAALDAAKRLLRDPQKIVSLLCPGLPAPWVTPIARKGARRIVTFGPGYGATVWTLEEGHADQPLYATTTPDGPLSLPWDELPSPRWEVTNG